MNDIDRLIKKRFKELYERSYSCGCYENTDFLNLAEQSSLKQMILSGEVKDVLLTGGYDSAERRIAVFGNENDTGYAYSTDITVIKISSLSEKFAEKLSHRDCLGAILSLGIKREFTGDILIDGYTAYVFVINTVAAFITENLKRIKHTDITCSICDDIPNGIIKEPEAEIFFISSERLDCVISAVFNLSRTAAREYFEKEKVFVNSALAVSPSAVIKQNDIISVRGMGRFKYLGIQKETKKGRLCVLAGIYK